MLWFNLGFAMVIIHLVFNVAMTQNTYLHFFKVSLVAYLKLMMMRNDLSPHLYGFSGGLFNP
jgi:hypothetical protein